MSYFCLAVPLSGDFYSNLLGRRVVEVVVEEGLAPCEDVVACEEWDVPLHTCEMAGETMTGGQACLLHLAWGMATMTAMIGAMTATTHHVVDHHQSCLHVTGELSVLSVLLIKLFYSEVTCMTLFEIPGALTCLTGNQRDDRTQTWCAPRMSADPFLMLAAVLMIAHQCHQCPPLSVALTMLVPVSPQTSIADVHLRHLQVMELEGECI